MSNLSKKQEQILEFLKEQVQKKGYPPSVREICNAVGLSSPSTVHGHLAKLEEKGYIRVDYQGNVWVCGDHTLYYRSDLYALLCHTAMEAQSLPDCVFDVPAIRKGYVYLTTKGKKTQCF